MDVARQPAWVPFSIHLTRLLSIGWNSKPSNIGGPGPPSPIIGGAVAPWPPLFLLSCYLLVIIVIVMWFELHAFTTLLNYKVVSWQDQQEKCF